jgi:hypothetical protein
LNGLIVYKSEDSLHGLLVTPKELELSYKDIYLGSLEKINNELQLRYQLQNRDLKLNELLFQNNYFHEYGGFKLPTFDQINKIRFAYKSNVEIEQIFKNSSNRNNYYPWIYNNNGEFMFINTLSSNSSFNFGVKYQMKFLNYIKTDFNNTKAKAIIRLVKEF